MSARGIGNRNRVKNMQPVPIDLMVLLRQMVGSVVLTGEPQTHTVNIAEPPLLLTLKLEKSLNPPKLKAPK